MGGLWASTWQYVEITFPVILVATVILYAYARDLNLMLSGEEISAAPRRKRGEPQKDPLSNVSIIVE